MAPSPRPLPCHHHLLPSPDLDERSVDCENNKAEGEGHRQNEKIIIQKYAEWEKGLRRQGSWVQGKNKGRGGRAGPGMKRTPWMHSLHHIRPPRCRVHVEHCFSDGCVWCRAHATHHHRHHRLLPLLPLPSLLPRPRLLPSQARPTCSARISSSTPDMTMCAWPR